MILSDRIKKAIVFWWGTIVWIASVIRRLRPTINPLHDSIQQNIVYRTAPYTRGALKRMARIFIINILHIS